MSRLAADKVEKPAERPAAPRLEQRPSPAAPAHGPAASAHGHAALAGRGRAVATMHPGQVLQLQALAGNRAVSAMLNGHAAPAPAPPVPAAATPLLAPTVGDGTQPPGVVVQRRLWDRLVGGVASVASGVRERVLGTLAGWARRMPGYGLLCVVIGRDVLTGAAVDRSAVSLVGGFMGLIPGGQAMFDNLRRAGAVQRAADWFSGAVDRLGLTWDTIRSLFTRAWDALGTSDLLDPAGAWAKLAGIFGPPLQRLRSFAVSAARKVLEFVFEGVLSLGGSLGGQIMAVIRRAGGALGTIVRDPIRFAGNLIDAVRGGLGRFAANIGGHLRTGMFAWLTGALRGAVTLPARLDWRGILGFILDVLGVTWSSVRIRLVRLLGEPVVRRLETAVDWVRSIVTGGLGAIADRILGFASGLVDTLIGGIRDWVARSVVGAAIARLVAMFNPAGAIIGAILAVYNTIRFFIERAQQLNALARSVFDSIAAIAAGNLGNAITAVEQAMARALPVVLGFLARLIGLGDVSGAVRGLVGRARGVVDRAMDRVVDWIAGLARRLVGRGDRGEPGAAARDDRTPAEKEVAVDAALAEVARLVTVERVPIRQLEARLPAMRVRHRLTSLILEGETVTAALNPVKSWTPPPAGTTAGTGGVVAVSEEPTTPIAVCEVSLRGELLPALARAGAPNYNLGMPRIATLPAAVRNYVQGYEWAHLWGPGLGDESSHGLMLAHGTSVNRGLQSHGRVWGIEGYLQRLERGVRARGGRVFVEVTGISFPDPPPGVPVPLGQPVLRLVMYKVFVHLADGTRLFGEADIRCGPPRPNGGGGLGQPDTSGFLRLIDQVHFV